MPVFCTSYCIVPFHSGVKLYKYWPPILAYAVGIPGFFLTKISSCRNYFRCRKRTVTKANIETLKSVTVDKHDQQKTDTEHALEKILSKGPKRSKKGSIAPNKSRPTVQGEKDKAKPKPTLLPIEGTRPRRIIAQVKSSKGKTPPPHPHAAKSPTGKAGPNTAKEKPPLLPPLSPPKAKVLPGECQVVSSGETTNLKRISVQTETSAPKKKAHLVTQKSSGYYEGKVSYRP